MKLRKYLNIAASVTIAASIFAGCAFEGTTADFSANEHNRYTAVGSAGSTEVVPAGSISVSTYENTAKEKGEYTITINSYGRMNEDSIKAACDFYPLTDNPADKYFYPIRGTALTKTIRKIDYDENSSITTVYVYVDTSKVQTSAIAFVADATKLKEKSGKLILNGNGNEKCGEATDSYITYLGIAYQADKTTATVALHNVNDEESSFSVAGFLVPGNPTEDGTSGKMIYRINVGMLELEKSDGTKIIPDGFAEALGKMYYFRTLAIGESKWTEKALTWKWDAENKRYEATTDEIAYGTRYCLSVKQNNSLEWAAAKDFFGVAPRISYMKNMNYYTNEATYIYAKEDSAYIHQAPDNTATTASSYTAANITLASFEAAQDALLSVTKHENAVVIELDDSDKVRFGEYAGFVITDNKYNIIKTKAPAVWAEDKEGVTAVIIELEDKALNLNSLLFWVGEKTTLKGNSAYPTQVKFGRPAVEAQNNLTGYVNFN